MFVLKLSACCRAKMFMLHLIVLGVLFGTVLGFSADRDHHTDAEHYFRHQQHYNSQRAEHGAFDDLRTAPRHHATNASHLVLLRHRHHEHPPSVEEDEEPVHHPRTTGAPPTPSRRHHLRHYNRHHQTWEQRVFPALRHQQTTTTTTTSSPPTSPPGPSKVLQKSRNAHYRRDHFNFSAQSRMFDRDGLYSSGPKTRHGFAVSREPHMLRSFKEHDIKRNLLVERFHVPRPLSEEDYEDRDNGDDYYDDDDADDGDGEDDDDTFEGDDDGADEDDFNANEKQGENREHHGDERGQPSDEDADEDLDENANHIDNDNILPAKLRTNIVDHTLNTFSKSSYIPGTLTKHKYETLGTHEAVKQSRKFHITNQQHHRALANAHATKVHIEATCKWPKPKVEKIQKDPSKLYVPHCTILHRCGDDTGCCNTDLKTCIAKRTQAVDLYFFVKALGSKHGTIERHTFVNHTECQCVEKSKHTTYIQSSSAFLRKATILDCNCPRLFEKVLQENGVCRCDCSSGNTGCDWLKRGMEHFSMSDRKCISEGRCKYPTCEYGKYDKDRGRCPKKESRAFH